MNQSDQVIWDDLIRVVNLDSLFKYTTAGNGIQLLENNTLYFNSPLNFNDPFDCHPLLVKVSDQFILNTLKQSKFKDLLRRKNFTSSDTYLNLIRNLDKTQIQVINKQILPKVKNHLL